MDGKNISSGEYIYSKLKEMIQKGQLKAGDKLPTEMELSKKYSVSRNTVRGAINRLIVLGMVESFQGKGTYVKETNFTNQIQNVLPMFLSGGSDYFSLMNLRTAIESQAAYMAAQRATYRDIKELEKIIDDLEREYSDKKKGIFMPNDTHANVLLNLLFQRYGKLPETYQIIGFDNSPISREAVIPTSTVGQQISVIASEAMELLSELLEERKKRRPTPLKEPVHKIIPPILIRRGTTV